MAVSAVEGWTEEDTELLKKIQSDKVMTYFIQLLLVLVLVLSIF